MLGYSDLPPELRQHILNYLVPEKVVYQRWPMRLVNLFLVNKQFLSDISQLLRVNPPTYMVTSPRITQSQYQISPQQQTSTLCLPLFDSADTQIDWITTYGVGFVRKTYFKLLEAWIAIIPQLLTPGIKTVMVDATPASGYIRRESPEYLAYLVNDMYYRRSILRRHQQPMAELFKQIAACSGEIKVQLVGVYSTQHQSWMEEIVGACREGGVDLEIEANFVDKPDTLLNTASLTQAVKQVRPEMEDLGQDSSDRLHACEALQLAKWKSETLQLYRTCGAKYPKWTTELLRFCASFCGNRYLQLQTTGQQMVSEEQARLFLSIAEDLGLSSETFGNAEACNFQLSKRTKS